MDNLIIDFKINVLKIIKIFFLYGELLPYNSKATEQIRHLYSKIVGKVVFSTVIIRLNNTQATSKLTESLINPNLNYMKAINYNIYYLVLNKYLTIKFQTENKDGELITVTDKVFTAAANALYKNNLNRRSGKGHIFKLFKDTIN